MSPRLSQSNLEIPKGPLGMPVTVPSPDPAAVAAQGLTPPQPQKQTNKINSRHQIASHKSSALHHGLEKALFLLH